MSQFQVIPSINGWLVGKFSLIFFICKYPQIQLILSVVVVLLQVLWDCKVLLVNDIHIFVFFVTHIWIVGGYF